jgi:short-subunit dehydrogenase
VIVAENARPPIDGGTVLVTGASAGIGRELAVQLAPRAGTLVLLARRAERLEELRASLQQRYPRLQVLTLPLMPRELARRQAARSATRLRGTAKGAASAPGRPEGQQRA